MKYRHLGLFSSFFTQILWFFCKIRPVSALQYINSTVFEQHRVGTLHPLCCRICTSRYPQWTYRWLLADRMKTSWNIKGQVLWVLWVLRILSGIFASRWREKKTTYTVCITNKLQIIWWNIELKILEELSIQSILFTLVFLLVVVIILFHYWTKCYIMALRLLIS